LTAQQPENNVVRVAYQALAAILGGTQSLHTNAKDEALALPTEEAARLALRTQQILAHESKVPGTADPLGGSWLVERLTVELEEEIEAYLSEIRSIGGVLKAIENGFIQREIQDSAYEFQKKMESDTEIVVGVNKYNEPEDKSLEILRIEKALEKRQIERVQRLKEERNRSKHQKALDLVRQRATGGEALLPAILEAVRALATVGEITETMGEIFGVHKETIVF
jgi:methylmalonyl-CoA mutase N-terminal domain/subunit